MDTRPFLLFSGETYYPNCGWEDLRAACHTLEEAQELLTACAAYGLDWYQIVDVRTQTVLKQGTFSGQAHTPFTPDVVADWHEFLGRYRTWWESIGETNDGPR